MKMTISHLYPAVHVKACGQKLKIKGLTAPSDKNMVAPVTLGGVLLNRENTTNTSRFQIDNS
ncbi:hypothetical protein ES708_21139 [subsurface metagenome]